ALFSVINPLGTLPIFIGLTSDKSRKEITGIAFKSSLNTFVILLISFFLGKYLLTFFGISLEALKIAGGLIIASSGFALLTGNFFKHKGMKEREKEDAFSRSSVSLTPIAIPMLAGPGSISLLITYNREYSILGDKIILICSIFCISVITYILLISSRNIIKVLGASGINALSRIIGFIVISIGIQYVISTFFSLLSGIIKVN
ncbi:MAG: MarC family protein, partial [Bacteroidota bacterium]|nr:MarC family protein [Bacteroidota bacterium]